MRKYHTKLIRNKCRAGRHGIFLVALHHCGHEVPLDEAPGLLSMTAQHDFHHKAFNCNYGVLGLCDWFYGTRGGYDTYHDKWVLEGAATRARAVAAAAMKDKAA